MNLNQLSFLKKKGITLILFVASFSFVAGGLLLLYIVGAEKRMVTSVRVVGNSYLDETEVIRVSGITKGRAFTGAELHEAETRLENLPAVLDADIGRSGKELRIHLKERTCAAIVRSDGLMYDVDEELYILSTRSVKCTGVPIITGRFELKSNRIQNSRLEELLSVWPVLRTQYAGLYERISEIRLNRGGGMTLFLARNRMRIEMDDAPGESEIRRLYAAVSYIENEKREAGLLDLRGPDAVYIPDI